MCPLTAVAKRKKKDVLPVRRIGVKTEERANPTHTQQVRPIHSLTLLSLPGSTESSEHCRRAPQREGLERTGGGYRAAHAAPGWDDRALSSPAWRERLDHTTGGGYRALHGKGWSSTVVERCGEAASSATGGEAIGGCREMVDDSRQALRGGGAASSAAPGAGGSRES